MVITKETRNAAEKVDKLIIKVCEEIMEGKEIFHEDLSHLSELIHARYDMSNMKCSQKEMACVFHWLNCLYGDFLAGRVAGEQMPCNSCKEVNECKSCPPINFNLAGERFGLEVEYRKSKSQK